MKNAKKKLATKMRTGSLVKKDLEKGRPHGVPVFLTKDWDERKKLIAKKVENKIAKVKARKMERLAKQEAVTPKELKKLSPAEQRQLRRKAKMIKFTAKLKAAVKL